MSSNGSSKTNGLRSLLDPETQENIYKYSAQLWGHEAGMGLAADIRCTRDNEQLANLLAAKCINIIDDLPTKQPRNEVGFVHVQILTSLLDILLINSQLDRSRKLREAINIKLSPDQLEKLKSIQSWKHNGAARITVTAKKIHKALSKQPETATKDQQKHSDTFAQPDWDMTSRVIRIALAPLPASWAAIDAPANRIKLSQIDDSLMVLNKTLGQIDLNDERATQVIDFKINKEITGKLINTAMYVEAMSGEPSPIVWRGLQTLCTLHAKHYGHVPDDIVRSIHEVSTEKHSANARPAIALLRQLSRKNLIARQTKIALSFGP